MFYSRYILLTILGNRVANIGRALGMSALIADRKGLPESSVRSGRASFEEALKRSTIIMITVP
jgi:glycerate dehydrogenase